jgi:hypothetical protein
MLALLALSAASAGSATKVESNAQARVRVLRAASASKTEWAKSASPHKKVVLLKEPDGQLTLVRIVEYE